MENRAAVKDVVIDMIMAFKTGRTSVLCIFYDPYTPERMTDRTVELREGCTIPNTLNLN